MPTLKYIDKLVVNWPGWVSCLSVVLIIGIVISYLPVGKLDLQQNKIIPRIFTWSNVCIFAVFVMVADVRHVISDITGIVMMSHVTLCHQSRLSLD